MSVELGQSWLFAFVYRWGEKLLSQPPISKFSLEKIHLWLAKITELFQKTKWTGSVFLGLEKLTFLLSHSTNHCCALQSSMLNNINWKLRVIFQFTHNLKTPTWVWTVLLEHFIVKNKRNQFKLKELLTLTKQEMDIQRSQRFQVSRARVRSVIKKFKEPHSRKQACQ